MIDYLKIFFNFFDLVYFINILLLIIKFFIHKKINIIYVTLLKIDK